MENPFRYGEIVSGSFFTDREQELADLVSDALSGQNVVIISPRRYGKTSLVLIARERLISEGALVVYVDLLRVSTLNELANELATALYNGIVAPLQRLKHQIGEIFGSLPVTPKVVFNPNGTWGVELAVSDKRREAELMQRKVRLGFSENLERSPSRLAHAIGPQRMRIDRKLRQSHADQRAILSEPAVGFADGAKVSQPIARDREHDDLPLAADGDPT